MIIESILNLLTPVSVTFKIESWIFSVFRFLGRFVFKKNVRWPSPKNHVLLRRNVVGRSTKFMSEAPQGRFSKTAIGFVFRIKFSSWYLKFIWFIYTFSVNTIYHHHNSHNISSNIFHTHHNNSNLEPSPHLTFNNDINVSF